MSTILATSLSAAARRTPVISSNIDASAGATDKPVVAMSLPSTLKSIRAICTEIFVTEGITVQIGTAATAGAYGTITLTTANMAAVGDAVEGTITTAATSTGDVLVIDATAKSGAGEFVVQIDYEYAEQS